MQTALLCCISCRTSFQPSTPVKRTHHWRITIWPVINCELLIGSVGGVNHGGCGPDPLKISRRGSVYVLTPLKCLYQRFHPSRVMGWWLVLLVNYAVIGNLKWDGVKSFYYEQTTLLNIIFSIFYVICVRPFKQSINSTVTKTGWLCYQKMSLN